MPDSSLVFFYAKNTDVKFGNLWIVLIESISQLFCLFNYLDAEAVSENENHLRHKLQIECYRF